MDVLDDPDGRQLLGLLVAKGGGTPGSRACQNGEPVCTTDGGPPACVVGKTNVLVISSNRPQARQGTLPSRVRYGAGRSVLHPGHWYGSGGAAGVSVMVLPVEPGRPAAGRAKGRNALPQSAARPLAGGYPEKP